MYVNAGTAEYMRIFAHICCDQFFLHSIQVGSMNIFMVMQSDCGTFTKLVTPSLRCGTVGWHQHIYPKENCPPLPLKSSSDPTWDHSSLCARTCRSNSQPGGRGKGRHSSWGRHHYHPHQCRHCHHHHKQCHCHHVCDNQNGAHWQVLEANGKGKLVEMFGTGTAATITQVGNIRFKLLSHSWSSPSPPWLWWPDLRERITELRHRAPVSLTTFSPGSPVSPGGYDQVTIMIRSMEIQLLQSPCSFVRSCIMDTCIKELFIVDACTMDTCIMDICITRIKDEEEDKEVNLPERPKAEVKQIPRAQSWRVGPPARSWGLEGP